MSATAEQKHDLLMRELWHVAGTGDVVRLEQILAQGIDVNASDRTGVTALMRAAYHGELPMVCALIEHGAGLDAKDTGGLTALMMAKHSGHPEIVDALLSAGATENAKRRVHKSLPVDSDLEEAAGAITYEKPETRTLHDPPEIWDLVHTTQADFAPETESARTYPSARILLLAACLLIVAAGAVSGVFMLWKSASANDATVRREVTPSEKAKAPATSASSTNQPSAPIQNAPTSEPPTAAAKATSVKPSGEVDSARTTQTAAPLSAQVSMPVKKATSKSSDQSANNSRPNDNASVFRTNRADNTQKTTARAPKSNSDKSASAAAVKNEAVKTPSPQATASPKPIAPKPKVIQWP